MKTVQVKFASWDKIYYFDSGDFLLLKGEKVIVDTEFGQEIGKVFGFKELSEQEITEMGESLDSIKKVIRKATKEDITSIPSRTEEIEAIKYCKELVKKHQLNMKLVDVIFSFSKSRITFAFIADGRIDFRELVKDLTSHFNKMIRLTQIGIRDEARLCGDCGHCGRELCCKGHINTFESITSEMAEAQQVVHRGSDRISGVCGRLMCCLNYEQLGYKELAEKMPNIGQSVNVDGRKGTILGVHVLKQSVDVEFKDQKGGRSIEEIDLNRHKK